MIKKQSRSEVRVKKHMKVRNRLSGHSRETSFSCI